MSFKRFHPLAVGCVLAVLMSVAPAVLGQVTTTSQNPSMTARSVPSGAKMKFAASILRTKGQFFKCAAIADSFCVNPTFSIVAITNTGAMYWTVVLRNSNMGKD